MEFIPPISDSDAIRHHFDKETNFGDVTLFSGFMAALREARNITNRQLDTGEKIPNKHYGSWQGTVSYMTVLNQIGNCFKPKNVPEINDNEIIKALNYFSTLSNKKIQALYALRCSFTHDFSLSNKNQKNILRQHRFLVQQGTSFLIKLPAQQWDGDFKNAGKENTTTVSLESFGDLVEDIVKKLIKMANDSELECILPGGTYELLHRYSFFRKN